jgi:endonuclease/exonuclease/phosphatase family metal-dependent hydrolase
MRIATFNLENLSGESNAVKTLETRCRLLRPQLNLLAADVLCLQEVGAEQVGKKGSARQFLALSALLEGTRYADYFLAHTTLQDGRGPLDVHNLITLSRYPIVRHRQLWNDLVSPPRYRFEMAEPALPETSKIPWDRPVLHTEIKLGNGRLLHVFNLHLRAPLASFIPGQKMGQFKWRTVSGWAEGFFVASIKRSGQALEVRYAVDRLFDTESDALIAVCGDMNAEEQEMPLRILRGDELETENPELAFRMMIPMEKAEPESRRYSVIHGGRPVMLDHMLVSRALFNRFQNIHIHNEVLKDELTDYQLGRDLSVSHHAPIAASFGFENSECAQ